MGTSTISWDRIFSRALLFLLPIHSYVSFGTSFVTPGTTLLLLLVVPMLASVVGYHHIKPLLVLTALCVVSAPLLIYIASTDHEINSQTSLAAVISLVVGVLTVVAILWARSLIGLRQAAIYFSAGLIVQAALNPAAWSTNAWKYAFAYPVSVFVLALLFDNNRRWLTVLALVALGAFSVANDYRSYFGFFLVVGFIFLWRWKREQAISRARTVWTFVGLLGVGFAVYWGGIWLALQGFLGYRNQVVTAAQMSSGDSLLLSGRSESGAAIQLFLDRPFGFGPGVVPTVQDIRIGRTGLAAEGVDANSDYVFGYLFNDGFKLHSIASDLWVSFGLAGLALAIFAAILLLATLGHIMSLKSPPALLAFVTVVAVWDLAFSPIASNFNELLFALGLVLPLVMKAENPSLDPPSTTVKERPPLLGTLRAQQPKVQHGSTP